MIFLDNLCIYTIEQIYFRMRRKTEEELTKLKDEYNDVKNNITSLTDQHDEVNIKNREEIDRLKFQVECMMKQHTMLPPVNMVGFR